MVHDILIDIINCNEIYKNKTDNEMKEILEELDRKKNNIINYKKSYTSKKLDSNIQKYDIFLDKCKSKYC